MLSPWRPIRGNTFVEKVIAYLVLLTLLMIDASTWRPLMPAANIDVTVDSAHASEASAGSRAKLSRIAVAK